MENVITLLRRMYHRQGLSLSSLNVSPSYISLVYTHTHNVISICAGVINTRDVYFYTFLKERKKP